MPDATKLTVTCPGCESRLVVDRTTGEVLSHVPKKRPPADGKDFDALLGEVDRGKEEAERVFEREVAAHADRDRLLEEKFREAMERAQSEPDETPPRRPFDFD